MYRIEDYGQMLADETRTRAYLTALARQVNPGSVVLDIGTGTGIFALIACRLGARKVYAAETDDVITVARRIAEQNGFADRIHFIQEDCAGIELPEKVDVIVSDMHGTLPHHSANLRTIIDARTRLLAPGGRLIPAREVVWSAVVEAPDIYSRLMDPWAAARFDLDMTAARESVLNSLASVSLPRGALLSPPQRWCELDHYVLADPSHTADLAFRAERRGRAHGVVLWFDAELSDGVGFSNAPGQPPLVYRSSLLPWSNPVDLEPGDRINVRIRADYTSSDYLWTWSTQVFSREGMKADFRQSTFLGRLISPDRLRRRSEDCRPKMGSSGKVVAHVLRLLDGATPLRDIARSVLESFPDETGSYGEALARVGDIVEAYGASPP